MCWMRAVLSIDWRSRRLAAQMGATPRPNSPAAGPTTGWSKPSRIPAAMHDWGRESQSCKGLNDGEVTMQCDVASPRSLARPVIIHPLEGSKNSSVEDAGETLQRGRQSNRRDIAIRCFTSRLRHPCPRCRSAAVWPCDIVERSPLAQCSRRSRSPTGKGGVGDGWRCVVGSYWCRGGPRGTAPCGWLAGPPQWPPVSSHTPASGSFRKGHLT